MSLILLANLAALISAVACLALAYLASHPTDPPIKPPRSHVRMRGDE